MLEIKENLVIVLAKVCKLLYNVDSVPLDLKTKQSVTSVETDDEKVAHNLLLNKDIRERT